MRKMNQMQMALIAVNSIFIASALLHSNYKKDIEKLAQRYFLLKKRIKQNNIQDYKKVMNEFFGEIVKKVGPIEELVQKGFLNDVETFMQTVKFDPKIKKFIQDAMEGLFLEQTTRNISNEEKMIPKAKITNTEFKDLTISKTTPCFNVPAEPIVTELTSKNLEKNFFKTFMGSMALIITLNSFGVEIIESENTIITEVIENQKNIVAETIEDLNVFLENFTDRTLDIKFDDKQTMINILNSDLSYEKKFNQIFLLKDYTFDEKIDIILSSYETSYQNIFDYILSKSSIPIDIKMDKIMNSTITNTTNIMNYIVESKYLTVEEKVWYVLTMSNESYEKRFKALLTIENATQNQIIKHIINSDIISFKNIFDNILKLENLTKEQFLDYISYYNSIYSNQFNEKYNAISIQAISSYILNTNFLTKEEQVDCIWNLLENYTLNDKINFVLNLYQITYSDYINLLSLKQKNLSEEHFMICRFFDKVNQEKEIYIIAKYFDSKAQLDKVVAGCAAEGSYHYNDLYAVANVFFNRTTNIRYAKKYGKNPYYQFIAKGQFEVYSNGAYLKYLNSNSGKAALAKQAFYDMFYNNYEGIQHSYLEFRSWDTVDFSNNIFVKGGNRYGVQMNEKTRILYSDLMEETTNNTNDISRKLVK